MANYRYFCLILLKHMVKFCKKYLELVIGIGLKICEFNVGLNGWRIYAKYKFELYHRTNL